MNMRQHSYGWVPDLPDKRDINFQVASVAKMPEKLNMRSGCPPVYDQGQTGSCTGQAIAAGVSFERHKQGLPYLMPSRLFIYWNERALEGTTASDSGAMIRDGMKATASQGVCSEYRWPFNANAVTMRPPPSAFAAAVPHKTMKYLSVGQTAPEMLNCLALEYPFVFGVSVYDSFESEEVAATGDVPMPTTSTETLLGGHALLAIGFDLTRNVVLFRNSWGSSWGDQGYGTIPLAYLEDPDLSDDFWTIRLEAA